MVTLRNKLIYAIFLTSSLFPIHSYSDDEENTKVTEKQEQVRSKSIEPSTKEYGLKEQINADFERMYTIKPEELRSKDDTLENIANVFGIVKDLRQGIPLDNEESYFNPKHRGRDRKDVTFLEGKKEWSGDKGTKSIDWGIGFPLKFKGSYTPKDDKYTGSISVRVDADEDIAQAKIGIKFRASSNAHRTKD